MLAHAQLLSFGKGWVKNASTVSPAGAFVCFYE